MIFEVTTNSEEETVLLGKMMSVLFKEGDVLALDGDLGAGKTHFTTGFAEGLSCTGHVSSPTFTIVNEYQGPKFNLYHFDTYRLSGVDDFYDSGLDEYLEYGGICIIEWSKIISEALPENTVKGEILGVGDERRLTFDFDEKFFDLNEVKKVMDSFKATIKGGNS